MILSKLHEMTNDSPLLDIVDEQGNIIRQDTRENVHSKGLLHREIHVWFHTPREEIVFQHRGKDKDTYPDLLDATVGGHVEIGSSFEDTAIEETLEETGIKITKEDLKLIEYSRKKSYDQVDGKTNNVIRAIFFYKFLGERSDLRVEGKEAYGFEFWSLDKLLDISGVEKKRFISDFLDAESLALFRRIIRN